jgi:hypothetical protein
MSRICLLPALLGIGSFSVSACEFPQFMSETGSQSSRHATKSKPVRVASTSPARPAPVRAADPGAAGQSSSPATPREADGGAPVNLIGLEEQQVRALLGPPSAEEDRPPAKIWRYRKGGCSLNLSLYPDVQTRKFGTLTYEVKSDDDTDEGKRVCMADLQSSGQAK